MTTTVLSTGFVFHFPGSFITDSTGAIEVPPVSEVAAVVPDIRDADLMPFAGRLIKGSARRRRNPRWTKANLVRLELAKLCIDRALCELLEGLRMAECENTRKIKELNEGSDMPFAQGRVPQ